jgi:hypothetical protein
MFSGCVNVHSNRKALSFFSLHMVKHKAMVKYKSTNVSIKNLKLTIELI